MRRLPLGLTSMIEYRTEPQATRGARLDSDSKFLYRFYSVDQSEGPYLWV
jgi:hypothetical protein